MGSTVSDYFLKKVDFFWMPSLMVQRNSDDVSPKFGQPVSVRYTNLNRGENKNDRPQHLAWASANMDENSSVAILKTGLYLIKKNMKKNNR